MFLVSPKEDGELAATYADNMKRQPGIRATWEQVYLGARGELAFARLVGEKHLEYCREHLLRSDATPDDYRFDLPDRIDVKTAEQRNRNLVVNRVHPDVRYVLLRAARDIVADRHEPLELTLEVMGWSPGDKARFSPFRADPKKSFQLAADLSPISTLLLELVKSNLAGRNAVP